MSNPTDNSLTLVEIRLAIVFAGLIAYFRIQDVTTTELTIAAVVFGVLFLATFVKLPGSKRSN